MNERSSILPILPLVSVAALLVGLGQYVRPMADDFCAAGLVRDFGFLGAQTERYTDWSGYYTANLTQMVGAVAGPRLMFPIMCVLFSSWLALLGLLYRSTCVGLAVGIAVLMYSPALVQVLYWQDGMGENLLPLVLGAGACAIALGNVTSRRLIGVWLLVFAACGCHPAVAVLLIAGCCCMFLFEPTWRSRWPYLAVSVAGSLIGESLVAFAPGNANREAYYPEHPAVVWAVQQAVAESQSLVRDVLPAMVAIGACAALMMPRRPCLPLRQRAVMAVGVLIAAYATAVLTIALVWYAEDQAPEARSLFFGVVALIVGSAWCGRLLCPSLLRRPMTVTQLEASALVALLCLCQGAPQLNQWRILAPAYASAWGRMDAVLRSATGTATVALPPVPGGLDNLQKGGWVNDCVAGAYGLKGIHVP
jgi:hypothetical protein